MRPRHLKVEDVSLAVPKLSDRDRAKTEDLLERWSAVNNQVENRMSTYTRSLEKLHSYDTVLHSEESWLTETEQKVHDFKSFEDRPDEQAEGIEHRMEELTVGLIVNGREMGRVNDMRVIQCILGNPGFISSTRSSVSITSDRFTPGFPRMGRKYVK